jgi:hypothetical protein
LIPLTKNSESTGSTDADRFDAGLAAKGDTLAFERLYRRHVARIHSLVRRMLSADMADDVAQDVFVRAWQKLHLFRGDSAFWHLAAPPGHQRDPRENEVIWPSSERASPMMSSLSSTLRRGR